MTSKKRIGVLTGGGDCPGLNAVIRAVVKTAINDHGWEVVGIEDGFLGLIENRMRPLDLRSASNILTLGGTILGTSNKANPAKFKVGEDAEGNSIIKNVTDRCIENARAKGLDALVCIGGDGTMSGAADLIRKGLPCVGVPKTIDNDLMHTEVTFGFHTAVQIATEALDRIHTTASSHHRVMLVEMMGRYAGWLTLFSGAASGADVILIPEFPYDLAAVCEYCMERSMRGKAFTILAVAEGAKPQGGDYTIGQIVADSPDPIRLGGVSQVLAQQITEQTGLECRATVLGHVQRGGTPCAYDRVLATLFGHHALKLVAEERYNHLVVMQKHALTSVPIAEVADRQRLVQPTDPLVAACRSIGVSFAQAG
ncbi:MAG TPA: ATP-dependent 6-phosphofructokinase [Phycisphaerae bacterium]|nr:ATP-dependent 6-phosphofructokinase [Phycisphaerae bacterium]